MVYYLASVLILISGNVDKAKQGDKNGQYKILIKSNS